MSISRKRSPSLEIRQSFCCAIFCSNKCNFLFVDGFLPVRYDLIQLILREPDRDKDIEAFIKTLENLGKADIKCVCYNFMPVFDWTRTELDRMRDDGSTVLAYNQDVIDSMDPENMFDTIKNDMTSIWQFIQMIRLGVYLDSHVSFLHRKI